jgi:hypothetical protein
MQTVFQRLQKGHLKMNPEKCELSQKEVRYFGRIVSPERVTTDPEKLEDIKCWPQPSEKLQLRSFLRLCTYYRMSVLGFVEITKPFAQLTERKRQFY